jgi:hypothetical protein
MFVVLAVFVTLAWVASVTLLETTSIAVHLFLVIAAASLCMHFVRGRRLSSQT